MDDFVRKKRSMDDLTANDHSRCHPFRFQTSVYLRSNYQQVAKQKKTQFYLSINNTHKSIIRFQLQQRRGHVDGHSYHHDKIS